METLGDISVKPCETVKAYPFCFLLLGPIGAGKSHFIESLAGSNSLNISKDQLDGFTQEVKAYEVINPGIPLRRGSIYLIDTPGFSNPDRMDLEVLTQVKEWMTKKRVEEIVHILYFQPITEVRVGGQRRKQVEMLRSLIMESEFSMSQFTIVTTMWDVLSRENHQVKAEHRFLEYRNKFWKTAIDRGARLSRHLNTQRSAWSHLSAAVNQGFRGGLRATDISEHTLSSPHIYQGMLDQLEMGLSKQEAYREQRRQLFVNPNKRLEAVIIPAVERGDEDLKRMDQLLQVFHPPPPGFEREQDGVLNRLGDYLLKEAVRDVDAIQDALAQCGPRTDTSSLEKQLKEAQERVSQCRDAL